MPEDGQATYQVGNVGDKAVVLQGEYITNVSVNVQNVEDAKKLLALLQELGKRAYHGPLLRRLDPIVLVNRAKLLQEIRSFFEESDANTLFAVGMAGIGKSTLIRGSLEYRNPNTAAVWIDSESLEIDRIFADLDAGLELNIQSTLHDMALTPGQKTSALLSAVNHPAILILDNFESVLDEAGNYRNQDIGDFIGSLLELEHRLKTIITTRRLPAGLGQGTAGIDILHVDGLDDDQAKSLLQIRSDLSLKESEDLLSPQVLERLKGHPKFIELLASAATELPVGQIANGLLTATDIGEYIISQVFAQLNELELDVLRSAMVFRGAFTYEAMESTYHSLCGDGSIVKTVRSLVRRALFEISNGAQGAYYLHPLLRDAVPHTAAQEAAAHAAIAKWFEQQEFVSEDLHTWDDRLYHLRRAAEIENTTENFENYYGFIHDQSHSLEFAGWGRRIVSELRILDSLCKDENSDRSLEVNVLLGLELWLLGELKEAFGILLGTSKSITEALAATPGDPDPTLEHLLLLVNAKLGDALAKLGDIEEAQKYADGIAAIAEKSDDIFSKLRHAELRFLIARKSHDSEESANPAEMLDWANEVFSLASQLVDQERNEANLDHLSEAHFNLAIAYLYSDHPDKLKLVIENFSMQLRLKLEIKKLSGVGAGLLNMGAFVQCFDPTAGAAMLLTSEQIAYEIGEVKEHDYPDMEQDIEQLLSDPANYPLGCKALNEISEKLVNYYKRGLERRLGHFVELPQFDD